MVVYLDDATIFSKKRSDHLQHLKQIFERCQKYGISLNPKKTIFVVLEGNMLGHIITKKGIIVDPNHVKAIGKIPQPSTKKGMQSFLGKINFPCKFISNFSQISKPLQNMIKKDTVFKWDREEKESFDWMKIAIMKAPSLSSPDFAKYFILYTFVSNSSLAVILTQKDYHHDKRLISLMSTGIQGAELNT